MKATQRDIWAKIQTWGEDKDEKETRGGDRTEGKRERQDRSKLTQREGNSRRGRKEKENKEKEHKGQ